MGRICGSVNFRTALRASVRHRRHAVKQRILEAEIDEITHALRIKNAIQVIDLMLHDARMKALDRPVDRRTGFIKTLIAHAAGARHEPAHPGYREAALPALLDFVIEGG